MSLSSQCRVQVTKLTCKPRSIWLRDLKKSLDTPQVDRYYHGFDISSEQFPESPGTIQFSVQDLTVPFPQEHWGRYDLVHVRLLVAALEEPDYKAAIANISKILSMEDPSYAHRKFFLDSALI